MTQTITIGQLADFADAIYSTGTTPTTNSLIPSAAWTSLSPPSKIVSDGFYAETWVNTTTHEVVIAFRGTVPSDYTTLEQDAYIAAGQVAPGAKDAEAYALSIAAQVNQFYPGYTIAVTGHSLGGYEAQAALLALDKNPADTDLHPYGVVFDAPGLPSSLVQSSVASSYSCLNFYAQGDAIHLAGIGPVQLGQLPPVSLNGVGPSVASEFTQAAAAFRLGLLGGLGTAIAAAAATLIYNWVKPAHSIGAIVTSLNSAGNNQSIGSETENSYLEANGATPPNPNLSGATNGATVIGDGTGSSLTAQVPNSSGSVITSVSGVSGDGVLVPAADQSALQAQVAADGSQSAASQTLTTGVIASLESASNIYITESVTSTGAISVIMGTTPLGAGSDGPGELTITNASTNGRFEYGVPAAGQTAAETITGENSQDTLWVNNGQTYVQLTGGAGSSVAYDTWIDASGTQYAFSGGDGESSGTLTITNGVLGSNTQNSITIQNFNLSNAQELGGYMGIYLPGTLSIVASADTGDDPPAPNFVEGSNQSYTLSVDAPSTTEQILTVTLSGAVPSDFEVSVGDTIEHLNANGSFNVSLAAGETNVSFGLIDVTTDNGSSDIANGANLQLSASLPNPDTLVGGVIDTTPLTFSYVPQGSDTAPAPQISSDIVGIYDSVTGITTYTGDGGDDYIQGTGSANLINAQSSGNDSIIGGAGSNTIEGGAGNNVIALSGTSDLVELGTGFNTVNGSSGHDSMYSDSGDDIINANNGTDLILLGNGTNAIYADSQTSLANAIAQTSSGGATHVQGDLIAVWDGNNTIVGGDGNDLIEAGAGHDVIVMGPGSDSFVGGIEVTNAVSTWSTTLTPPTGTSNYNLVQNGVGSYVENFTNTYPQPYNGGVQDATGAPNGPSNDTVFGGTGNEYISFGNGNNYLETGSGNDTVFGGMGNDTIIAGSGDDTIRGGGGTTYIYGGSGADTLAGGDGNNTIIGGSGNSTISAASGPDGTLQFTNANLEQNYVTGGSGNDVIYGSAGQDTLIAGTGNTTIYGQTGNEDITGGSGNDLLAGGTGNNTIVAGGSGHDSLYANGSSSSTSYLYGGDGQDYIVGGSGINVLNAGDGGTVGAATTVFASQSDSTATTTIYGGLGVDYLVAGTGSSVIYGGDGGTAGAPTTLAGWTGNDTIYGGLGTDLIIGGTGPTDVLYAGDGGTAAAPTSVVGGTGVDTLIGGAGPSILQDTRSGEDLLISATANDTMIGVGSDTLVAGTGNDDMQSNGGSIDVEINAGFGNDTVTYNGGTANLLLGSGIYDTDFTGSIGFDSLGNSDLVLSGDGGSIAIEGGLTGDLLSVAYVDPSAIPLTTLLADAFGGDQTVTSGSSSFILNLNNAESISAGTSDDTVSSWGNNVSITGSLFNHIYSTGSAALIGSSGFDSIVATGNFDTVGGGPYGGDTIVLTGGNSIATVGSDFDGSSTTSITASGANDTINAGSGSVASIVTVNNASTVIDVSTGAGAMTVDASVSYTAPTNVSTLTLIGSGNISASGNTAADILMGGAGVDTVFAGSGIDTMTGGTGNTTFVINSASDVVQDTTSSANNTVESSVSYTLPTNVNNLILTGFASLVGSANSGNDTLTSNTGVDTLVGGSGHDTFILNNAADVVEDTAGSATIVYATSVNFTLPANVNTLTLLGSAAIAATGNSGNDSMTGNAGADTLIAGSGTDTLVAGSGNAADSLIAGTGNDLFVVNNASDIVSVGGTHGTDTIESSVSYTASANVANLTLTGTAALAATGNSLANVLTANSGADTLAAGSGVATLVGGAGNDTFVINSTSDVVHDSSTTAGNTLLSSVSYTLPTDVSSVILTGTSNLSAAANSGNDTLMSNAAVDTLVGGAGSDTFVINNAGDVVQDSSATASNSIQSSVTFTLPTDVNTLLLTGSANIEGISNASANSLVGGAGQDTLVAVGAYNTLVAGSGVSTLVANAAFTTLVVNNSADVISDTSGYGFETIQSSVNYTLPTNVSTLELTGSGNLSGTGVSADSSITGNAGNDTLYAGSGSETLVAGSGIDTLVGGTGPDTFVINSASDVLESISGAATNAVVSSVSYTMAPNIDILTLTGAANLVGTGNSASDTITANSGSDTLIAGSGTAELIGGLGSDLFIINNVNDVVNDSDYGEKSGVDTIQSSVSYTLPSNFTVLALSGTANITGTGNSHADSLIGNSGSDTLTAGTGNDTLIAGTGVTTLIAGIGSGNVTFLVNNAADVVQDSASTHNNVLLSSVSYTLPTNVNTMLLTGSANVVATANSAADSLKGNAGTDTLMAGGGTDTLVAGSGIDTLVGGSGSDTFVINNSSDVIESASASTQNVLFSSATYVLPTNINVLTLTGIANISGTGNASADTLTAGAGQDTLAAGTGLATLIGGIGNDTFVVNSASDGVQDSSTTTSNTVLSSVSYTLVANVNSLAFSGTSALEGTANSGTDTLTSNTGLDTLVGGSGNDTFVINNTGDIVQDTSTTATNTAQSSVNYTLAANVNTLVLTGTNALVGTANSGADSLVSNSGADTLVGGSGNDTFVVSNAADVVQDSSATASNAIQSSVNYTLPTDVNVLTLTGAEALAATGNSASDVITANSGNDTLTAGSGGATLVGGAGSDTFVVNSASDMVRDTVTAASNTIQASVSFSLATNVNTLVLTGTGSITGTANSGSDTLTSNSGVDTLVGGAGNDLFIINNSADVIQGATANDTIECSVNYTLPSSVNTLILVGTANISGTGNANSDTLLAGAGNDTLAAGLGTATLIGGAGNDTFVVNSANDVVQDSSTTATNVIQSSVSYTLPTDVDTLTLTGTSGLTATGNSDAANVLNGNSGNDLLVGTAFSSTLNGGTGSDTIDAGPETNVIYVGNGGTTSQPTYVYGNATNTNVTTQSTIYGGSGTDVLYGGPGSDLIYGGTGTDSIYGGTGFDSLYGSSGANVVDSLGGYDLLVAGGGPETLEGIGLDTLTAGAGNDLLYSSGSSSSTSMVYEFNAGFGQDTIGYGGSSGDNIEFGSGVSTGSVTGSASVVALNGTQNDIALVLNDGTGSIVVAGGFAPGVVTTVGFAGSGTESLTQYLNAYGPGTQSLTYGSSAALLSTGNNQTVFGSDNDTYLWAYGNDDVVTGSGFSDGTIYTYGNNSTITGDYLWVGGTADVVVSGYEVTIAGANDTVNSAYVGNDSTFVIQNSSTVINAAPETGDSIDSYVSYTLPTNVQNLLLEISVSGIVGYSNSTGGTLIAGGSQDTLYGGSGADTLVAKNLGDFLVGGSGTETYVLDEPGATIQYGTGAASLNSVQIGYQEAAYTLGGGANNLTVGAYYSSGTANSANDSLTATTFDDTLVAGSGQDTLVDASSYTVTMLGGSGNDIFVVQNAGDVISDSSTTSNNVVQSSISFSLPTNVNTLQLTGAGAVAATANSANDSLVGNAGNDSLVAGVGNDTLVAGSGADIFVFNSGFGHDQIVNAKNGVIQFGAGISESSLTFTAVVGTSGLAPSLVISGDGGSITVPGGLFPDEISSVNFTGGGSYTVGQLLAPSGRATITGTNGNLIISSNNDDSVIGGSGQDTIVAYGSNDTLNAGTGGTVIYAGGADDIVKGGSATDNMDAIGSNTTLVGGSGNETFTVSNPSATIDVSAGVGHDTVLASVSYTIPTNVSAMTMTGSVALTATGNTGNDTITGNSGDDTLISGSGVDTLIGGSNADTFDVNNPNDVVQPSVGATADSIVSTVNYTLPANLTSLTLNGSDIIGTGNAQADYLYSPNGGTLVGGTGDDTLSGYGTYLIAGSGQDVLNSSGYGNLVSGTGVDTLYGAYQDSLYINNSADVLGSLGTYGFLYTSVNYTLPSSASVSTSATNNWILEGSANLVATNLSPTASFNFSGNSGNDTIVSQGDGSYIITGGNGNNSVVGGNEYNEFDMGTGVDTFVGGLGTNYFYVSNAADVVEAPAGSSDEVFASASIALPVNVNTLYLGGTNLVGTANGGDDSLSAASGADTLIAGAGNDTLYADSANLTALFNSGFGNALVLGNNEGDSFDIAFGAGINAGSLGVSAALDPSGNAALSIADGSTAITVDDVDLAFQYGFDSYSFGFSGGSTQTLAQFLAEVQVNTSTVVGASGNLILEGTASTAVIGGSGSDTIYAGAANDTITAGTGSQYLVAAGTNDSIVGTSNSDTLSAVGLQDTLVGGSAIDTFIGGSGGTVTYVVNNAGDVVENFTESDNDTIDSSVSYALPYELGTLILTGTAALTGTASSDNDTLVGNTGASTLIGGSGNDTFVLNSAANVIQDTTSTANNTIQTTFNYTLPTDVNNLNLTGTGALTGTANNSTDSLTSNAGVDTLTGGTGNDTFVINNASDVVKDTSATATNVIESSVSYSLPTDVNQLVLIGSGNLSGIGNGASDSLVGGSGADTLTAGGGTDTLVAGTGLNALIGGSGNDIFIINNAADVIEDTSTTASNTIRSAISYTLPTNVNALIFTGSAAVQGTANSGTDSLTANSGADTLVGGSGNDTFYVSNTADVVTDTSATASNTISSTVSYSLITNVNALILTGSAALQGTANSGSDSLTANSGADTLVGGSGNDTFYVNNTADVVTDTSTSATNKVSSTVTYSLPTNVNALVFTGTAALKGTANSGNDSLTANTGSDTLVAGSGTDTLVAGTTGTDSLVGGSGNDTFFVNNTADIVTDTSSSASNLISSTVTYSLPTDVNTLVFTGTAALKGTANSGNDSLTANTGSDTLLAGSGTDTLVAGTSGTDSLVGGSGNDTFVVNNTADKVTDTSTTASNTIDSSVTYTLPTDVNTLILTGTAALSATGNTHTDSITGNSGTDTLTAGTGVATLIGGTGNDTFVINSASDVVTDSSTTATNTLSSTVSYTLPTNVNALIFTGTAALKGTANGGNDSLTANTGADTLVAGSGTDTLVAGTTGTDSLVGGTGNDTFVVNNTADKVTDTSTTASNTIVSSVSYTLPTDVQYLTLTGTSALTGTGNSLLDLIVGNTGADSLTGGTGIAALEGGKTAGSDQIKAASNQAALIAGGGSSTLSGGAYKDFYAAGLVSDSITTGATANVVSVNRGDGATTLQPTTGATNVLSLGAGIDTESLYFTKTGNNLILTDGVAGDSITFTNWYAGSADQTTTTLQVMELASANYNSGGSDPLRNEALEEFNFTSLVAAYNTAGSPSNWALSTAMPSARLSSSATAAYGGDLAYYFGLNGNLTGVDLSAVQSTLTNASYGTATQTLDSFSSITGGGGLHLLALKPGTSVSTPVTPSVSTATTDSAIKEATPTATTTTPTPRTLPRVDLPWSPDRSVWLGRGPEIERPTATAAASAVSAAPSDSRPILTRGRLPEPRMRAVPLSSTPVLRSPRYGIEEPARSESSSTRAAALAASDINVTKRLVDPVNLAWVTLHGALDRTSDLGSGAEVDSEHEALATDALLASAPLSRVRRGIGNAAEELALTRRAMQ